MSTQSPWQIQRDESGAIYWRNVVNGQTAPYQEPQASDSTPRTQPDSMATPLDIPQYSPQVLLNDGYRRQSPSFFKVGRVFLTLWTAPSSLPVSSARSDITPTMYGETAFTRIRRFVVIRERHSHCDALPIMTYEYQGVAKRGVRKSDHAIIHTGRDAPDALPGERARGNEDGMRPFPIRVNPDTTTGKLHAISRIDFARTYPVEHNLKVMGFGMVVNIRDLLEQYQEVCAEYEPNVPQPSGSRANARGSMQQPNTQNSYTYRRASDRSLPAPTGEDENAAVATASSSTPRAVTGGNTLRQIYQYLVDQGAVEQAAENEAYRALETRTRYNSYLDNGYTPAQAGAQLTAALQRQLGTDDEEAARARVLRRLRYATGDDE